MIKQIMHDHAKVSTNKIFVFACKLGLINKTLISGYLYVYFNVHS